MIVTEAAPAKVNLTLRVLEREASGYHALQTLFCALELHDDVRLDVGPSAETDVEIEVNGADLGPPETNLAWRAARSFLDAARVDARVRIRLDKRIPAGGGLGGGSSDAAATLRALDRAFPRRLDTGTLASIGARLGSDVPFFLSGSDWAWGEGRGERLTPVPPLPSRSVVVVIPPFPVATADAYRWLDDARAERDASDGSRTRDPAGGSGAAGVRIANWDDVTEAASNDFERVVFDRHPQLERIRDTLAAEGGRPALLAGSGSTVFAVFAEGDRARGAEGAAKALDPELRTVITRTRSR